MVLKSSTRRERASSRILFRFQLLPVIQKGPFLVRHLPQALKLKKWKRNKNLRGKKWKHIKKKENQNTRMSTISFMRFVLLYMLVCAFMLNFGGLLAISLSFALLSFKLSLIKGFYNDLAGGGEVCSCEKLEHVCWFVVGPPSTIWRVEQLVLTTNCMTLQRVWVRARCLRGWSYLQPFTDEGGAFKEGPTKLSVRLSVFRPYEI